MSIATHHTYRGFAVRFDELEPINTITMRAAAWAALEQLEGEDPKKESFLKQRFQVKAKPKFVDGKLTKHEFADSDEPESSWATEAEAKKRARELKDAGHHVAIVEPTEAPPARGRYKVMSQLTATTPPVEDSTWATMNEAQHRAAEIEDEHPDYIATVIDSNSSAILPGSNRDGTATSSDPIDNVQTVPLPEHPAIENQPPAEEHHEQ